MALFDGYMPDPPPAGASEVYAGTQQVPVVETLAQPTDGAAIGVVVCESKKAIPRTLTIGFPTGGVFPSGPFPPFPSINTEGPPKCGIVDVFGVPFTTDRSLVCILEYGVGSASQKVYFDWCPGSYNLPSCSWARVSALAWGTGWTLNRYPANATITPGNMQNAHVPTVTGAGSLAAGVAKTFASPGCARGVEVTWLGIVGDAAPNLRFAGEVNAIRDYAASNFAPSPTPLETYPADLFTLSSDIDALVELKFYLAL